MVYVEWFGHWDKQWLDHHCKATKIPVNTNHCIISSIAYKIKYYKVINEFTLLFGNLLAIVDISITTIESLI